jgi:hypothetical protein
MDCARCHPDCSSQVTEFAGSWLPPKEAANSDVDLDNPQHVEKLIKVFRAASAHRMTIAVHLHPSFRRHRHPRSVRMKTASSSCNYCSTIIF